MSDQTHNSQEMTEYLLGLLPDAEAERLDELSVTDHAFAEALSVAERDLIDAYVHGELEGAALEQFKSHYLASPLRRGRVKFAEAFQVFAERSAAAEAGSSDSARRAAQPERAGWFSMLSASWPRLAWQWGLPAAALILLIAGGWLAFENIRLRQHAAEALARREELLQRERELLKEVDAKRSANSSAEQELARLRSERERLEQELANAKSRRDSNSPGEGRVVSFDLAAPLRGVAPVPTVSIPSGTSFVSMQLHLEPNDYLAYRVALLNQSNQTLWRSGKLKAKTTGEGQAIRVSFSAGSLKSQAVYVLRVAGIAADGTVAVISDYSFRVGK